MLDHRSHCASPHVQRWWDEVCDPRISKKRLIIGKKGVPSLSDTAAWALYHQHERQTCNRHTIDGILHTDEARSASAPLQLLPD